MDLLSLSLTTLATLSRFDISSDTLMVPTSPTSHYHAGGTSGTSLGVSKNSPPDLSSINTGRSVIGIVVNLDVALGLVGVF